jgi:hypothetical protein
MTVIEPKQDRVRLMRLLGAGAVLIVTAASTLLADRWPWVTLVASAVSWGVGKALGIPVDDIVRVALRGMAPDKVADIAVSAIASMPPELADTAARRIAASVRPAAVAKIQLVNTDIDIDASER